MSFFCFVEYLITKRLTKDLPPDPPVDPEFMIGLRSMSARERQLFQRSRALRQAEDQRRDAAVAFFEDGFATLAKGHAKALSDFGGPPTSAEIAIITARVRSGQQSLLQQADLSFGRLAADKALRQLGRDDLRLARAH